ncbi:hypothetical protein C6558_11995 [Ensifer sp. NM-2]|nr:hypothetical protein ASD00_33225 [Ensifer sp. Root31]PSS64267.1 hypothetical protein C6558_11995 [Ensifer sp. NM-2]
MSLLKLGRARLGMALPRHRGWLLATKDRRLDDLFESYALASTTLDNLRREMHHREALIDEYEGVCRDLQVDVVTLLALLEERTLQRS